MKKKLWINKNEYIFFEENPKSSITDEIATRKRAFDFYALGFNLPDPDPVLRKQGKDVQIYRELLSDAHVWACVQSRKAGVLSLNWEIDRGKAKSNQAKVIENVFNSLDMHSIISQILDASLFGFQPMEVIWKNIRAQIIPVDIKAKPVEWFVFDDENRLKLRTKENWLGELLPDKKFLLPQNNPSYQNPYGERILSRVFWPVTFKKGGLKFWVIFTEKYGMPFLVGKHPRGASKEDTDSLADMLEDMIQDAIAVIPDDSSVEIQDGAKTASSDIYDKLVDKMNSETSKAILGQTLTTELGAKGSFAASKIHMEVREEIVDTDKKMVERSFNQLIRWIYELNFSCEAGVSSANSFRSNIPVFSLWEEEDVDLNLAQRDKTLSDSGVKFSKSYYMKAYGFEEEDIESVNPEPQSPQKTSISGDELFRQFKQEAKEQVIIDDFIESFSDDELQNQAEVLLKPVIEMINKGSSYNEIQEKLSEKGLNTDQIEEVLQKVIFISEVWGRLNENS